MLAQLYKKIQMVRNPVTLDLAYTDLFVFSSGQTENKCEKLNLIASVLQNQTRNQYR